MCVMKTHKAVKYEVSTQNPAKTLEQFGTLIKCGSLAIH